VRRHKIEMMKKTKAKEIEYENEMMIRMNAESQVRMLEMREHLESIDIAKSRRLREIEEEIILKEQEYK
jgi:hypothetical protein